jgi:hypothetical protein
MARRIALVVIALVAVLLGVAAIPLGVLTASQDRRDFRADTLAAATTVSSVAEEFLSDHAAAGTLARSIAGLKRRGDVVAVYGADGRKVAGARHVPGVDPKIISGGHADQRPRVYTASERIVVVVPVTSDAHATRLGTVALVRSTEPLEHRLTVLWGWLAAVSAAALLAAALIATALARWVSRPLGRSKGRRSTLVTATSAPARPQRQARPRYAAWPGYSTGWRGGWRRWSAATRR